MKYEYVVHNNKSIIMDGEQKNTVIKCDNKDYTTTATDNDDDDNNTTHNQPLNALLPTPEMVASMMIKNEVIDANTIEHKYACLSKSQNFQTTAPQGVHTAAAAAAAANNSPKMGSRRIFTPQFKLQVLESYRNDNDCKGNQRATARKYNIHRRQIQKWLQCESNLRSSVANINHSNVKHHFHNITHHPHHPHHQQQQHQQQHHHHHQQQQQQQLQITLAVAANSTGSHYGSQSNHHQHQHHHHHHNQSSHKQQQMPLDTATQSVTVNSISVPSLVPTGVATANTNTAQGVLAAANLAAAAPGSASSPMNTSTRTTTSAVSSICPTVINCGNSEVTMSPSLVHHHTHQQHQQQQQHHHHHHHYTPLPYIHTPVSVPVSAVPILTHHISPQHLHHHYQFHNLSPHAHSLPPQTQHQSTFMPSTCLPMTVLSSTTADAVVAAAAAAAASAAAAAVATTTTLEEGIAMQEEQIRASDDLSELKSTIAKNNKIANTAISTGNKYSDENATVHECGVFVNGSDDNVYEMKCKPFAALTTASAISPMDLSIGSRRSNSISRPTNSIELKTACKTVDVATATTEPTTELVTHSNAVVDLTFRKRKVIASNHHLIEEQPQEKLTKLMPSDEPKAITLVERKSNVEDTDDDDDDDDIEVEVGVEENSVAVKPVKLFKPYLLDDDDDDDNNDNNNADVKNNVCSENKSNKKQSNNDVREQQLEPVIWSNHPDCIIVSEQYEQQSRRESNHIGGHVQNVQPLYMEKHQQQQQQQPFHVADSCFPGRKTSISPSVLSPTTMSAPSPSFHSPKGSPVSGYESSSSTYSDLSECRSEADAINNIININSKRACHFDIEMHPLYKDNLVVAAQQNHVQRWLEHDINTTPPAASASIALYI